jgi:hypothetical protein
MLNIMPSRIRSSGSASRARWTSASAAMASDSRVRTSRKLV